MSIKHLLLVGLLSLLAACSSNKATVLDESLSESELYVLAQKNLDANNYGQAIESLRALESRYPFGRFAEQAQLELIYAYYQNLELDAAKSAADRFIRLHPQHPDVDYAYYLRGMTSFTRDRGLFERFLPLDMTRRDPGAARDSFNEFAQLVSRYPNSRYAPDARQRMVYLRNLLAAYDTHVGHYYLKRGAYVAAVNRGRYIVENFQQTPSVGDGLALMVEGYRRLAMDDLANNALLTLQTNYPEHPSLQDGEFRHHVEPAQRESGWVESMTTGLLDKVMTPPSMNRETQMEREMEQQYQAALNALPRDIKTPRQEQEPEPKRSIWSRLTFGLFD
ncbi:outer membrane protein assembly factor BamD [Pseudomonas sp. G11-1]|uniref:Outer membrane protein assembly factor BamD n=1 Tax=Halopseudomonas bauzanensis TaxID=653930 RepID=A0A031MFW8_9GAMM|nr:MULTISPECIES: outer membrane protein assembly factor BamD [Halopseudomonas]MCO5786579.1 outer membrane protein assembly factor BamD [Pseudomonas sp. G11-1]MCO5789805.1 outer membrane protein assembly factor BamD [Pseudomonas sp. G11-2]EZQ18654.1 DNA transporter [Halopseudomonas bauzanensis]TKA92275.1 outer membrane protein assembly factor BamD [Halopseudomonas bauzanensis]WGK62525.1 outer membrane protein assembly factor BamD [Halopseudomonas sp. SMJS2]